jgi:hypothetical protein
MCLLELTADAAFLIVSALGVGDQAIGRTVES